MARAHARSLNESVDGIQTLDTDIPILGAGGAGLFATLHAKKARPELDVTIAVKGRLGTCGSTHMVQGGYNVALAPEVQSSATSWTRSRAAGWLNDQELATSCAATANKQRAPQ